MKIDSESSQPQRIYLKDYQSPAYSISETQLYFNLFETKTIVTNKMKLRKIKNEKLVLNGENLKLVSVKLNEHTLTTEDYELTSENLTFKNVPEEFQLEIKVEINPEANKSCVGLYLSKGIFATQCEAEGFRHITYFLDRPDVMTSYSVEIEADQKNYPVLLSNGDLLEKKEIGNGRHKALWKDPFKKPSYLFALVAGDLGVISDTFTTRSGKNVKLEVFASHGKQRRCYFALESLKKAMKWDEERFGLEYDLNQFMIVSIDDFNMGAMENKGLNIFNSRLVLADPASATDTDYERIESVVGHEYFHNWTGNRVTCRNWFELSLKEGLTVFRDQEFSADLNSRSVQRVKDVDMLRNNQFAEDAGPNAHPVRPESCLSVDNFYTATIYEKGAEVIRMIQTIVGQKGFRQGIDEYFKRHDGQAVTILDFVNAISEPNQVDLTQFKLWYSQAGTPQIDVIEKYDVENKKYLLTLKQSCNPTEKFTEKQPIKMPFHIPLRIGLLDSSGKDMKMNCKDLVYNSDQKPLLHLKQNQQTFIFDDVNERPVLSINREFSAPVNLNWPASEADLLHLIKFDSDEFNRREAIFKMTLQEIQRLITASKNIQALIPQTSIIEAMGSILNDSTIDAQFKALMLKWPSEDLLAQVETVLDAVAFKKAYNSLTKAFVEKFEATLLTHYKKHHAENTPQDRALKNQILKILTQAEHKEAVTLANQQFNKAKNLTDELGALMCLCQTDSPEKELALTRFYEKWKDDAVVFNKWLQVQAASTQKNTFEHVQKLTSIQPFSFENPNNIYSLIGVLGDNYFAMHDETGRTYAWYCDQILKVDQKNPQVAARLCSSFNFVKKLPDQIKTKAQTEIKRVLANDQLSKNSRELLEGCI